MPKRSINITLDIAKKDNFPKFDIKQFDNATLNITLLENGVAYSTSGSTAKLSVGVNNDLYFQEEGIVVNDNGLVIDLDNNLINTKCTAFAEIELKDNLGTLTSSTFTFNIVSKIGEGANIPSGIEGFVAKYEKLISEFKAQVDSAIDGIDGKLDDVVSDLQADYDSLKKVIIDENASANLQNQINTLDSELETKTKNDKCNIKDYGAIGDWTSHQAIEFYSTLEELKKDYPLATSLTDEMDSLALEKALSENFREVYIPYGGYKINKSFNLNTNQRVYGGGKDVTQLDCIGTLSTVFNLMGSNITIDNLKIATTFIPGNIGTSNTVTTCINGDKKNHLTFDNLFIVGFNKAISLGENAYVTYMDRLRIQSCNVGISGHGEFNNVIINKSSVTYCDICLDIGAGSNILIQGCDIERSNRGLIKKSIGDVNIRDNYFELNEVSSIEINWQTDFALIDGNSFFSEGAGQKDLIKYHTLEDKKIIITNNNFRSYNISGEKLNCLTPTNGTLVKPIFLNNVMTSDYIVGVNPTEINQENYYDNGIRVAFVTDLTNISNTKPSIRGVFADKGIVTLPSLKDLNKVFKLVFVKSGAPLETEYMTLNSTNIDIVGENRINPNQIYSIYFNRLVGEKEEVIICKG